MNMSQQTLLVINSLFLLVLVHTFLDLFGQRQAQGKQAPLQIQEMNNDCSKTRKMAIFPFAK